MKIVTLKDLVLSKNKKLRDAGECFLNIITKHNEISGASKGKLEPFETEVVWVDSGKLNKYGCLIEPFVTSLRGELQLRFEGLPSVRFLLPSPFKDKEKFDEAEDLIQELENLGFEVPNFKQQLVMDQD